MDSLMLRKIKLKGKMFEEETGMDLFVDINNNGSERISQSMLIYGKNGTGKSTISNAIYCDNCENNCEMCEFKENKLEKIEFLTEGEKEFSYEKNNIYVYNEMFVEKKIKFNSNGLDSIVMFDKQKEIDDKINLKILEKKKFEDEQKQINSLISEMQDVKDNNSILFLENQLTETLKRKWAVEGKYIHNRSINSSVNMEKVSEIYSCKTSRSVDELQNEYQDIKNSRNILNSTEKILDELKNISIDENIDGKIEDLLKRKIDKPNISEREEKIFNLIKNEGKQLYYKEVKETFSNDNVSECPYCFQQLTKDYKDRLVRDIEAILNPDTEKHIKELDEIELLQIDRINEKIKVVNEIKYNELNELINQYNLYIQEIEKLIQTKKNNVYEPIEARVKLVYYLGEINKGITDLEKDRIIFNDKIGDVKKLNQKLDILNNQIAYYDIKDLYEIYLNKKIEFEKLIKRFEINSKMIEKYKLEISEMESEKANTKVAMEEINKYLGYIFFEKDRIRLENANGKYVVKVRNKNIQLNQLSLGEKNAISLCYFFSLMGQNKKINERYIEESLVIMDDPISSFDFENKIGIYTFLEKVFRDILCQNANNKLICFTHSLEVTDNLQKIFSSIGIGVITKELKNKQLIQFNVKSRNEYGLMLKDIYDFANGERFNELESNIGNIMRRVLEAYGTFNYKLGIDKIFTNDKVLFKIKDEVKKEHLKNLAYRLVLNTESHRDEYAMNYPEEVLEVFVSNEEKQKTARMILVGLYLIDNIHIERHIMDNTKILNIQKWANEI